jgi:hypothetical protein
MIQTSERRYRKKRKNLNPDYLLQRYDTTMANNLLL